MHSFLIVALLLFLFIPIYSLMRPEAATYAAVAIVCASCCLITWAILRRKYALSLRDSQLEIVRMSLTASIVFNTVSAFLYVGAKRQTTAFETHQLEWISIMAIVLTLGVFVETHTMQARMTVARERMILTGCLCFGGGFLIVRHIREWSLLGFCIVLGVLVVALLLFFIQQKIDFVVTKSVIPTVLFFMLALALQTYFLSAAFFHDTSVWLVPALLLVTFIGAVGIVMWQIRLTYVSTVFLELLYGLSLICFVCTLTVVYYTGSLLSCMAAFVAYMYTFFFLREW